MPTQPDDNSIAVIEGIKSAVDQEYDDKAYDLLESAIDSAILPPGLICVLREEVNDFMSESSRTCEEKAAAAGVHIATVFRARADKRYIALYNSIIRGLFQGKADVFFSGLIEAAKQGKVSAIKLGLEVQGYHIDKVQTHNVNVNTDIMGLAGSTLDIDEGLRRLLILYASKGYTLQRIIDTWQELKATQAFG